MDVLLLTRYFRRECLVETWMPRSVCAQKREWYMHYKKLPINRDMLLDLCELGCLDVIKIFPDDILHKNGSDALHISFEKGHLDVIQYLLGKKCKLIYNMMESAAYHGHLHIIQWLHEHRIEGCTTEAMDYACMHGHLHIVQWLYANCMKGRITSAMNWASARGHLHIVKWLHENRIEGCTTDAMDKAAANGHLHVVQWLHKNRTEGCTIDALNLAIYNGHNHVIDYLRKHNLV